MGAIRIFDDPIIVDLIHNDVPIGQSPDGFGGFVDVYEVERVATNNPTGTPWEFVAEPEVGNPVSIMLGAAEEKSTNIPTPQQFAHYPATYHLSLRRQVG